MLTFVLLALAQAPLPQMQVLATDGGSALVIRNVHPSRAITAYLVELVDYPGSVFAYSKDEWAEGTEPLSAGSERRVPIGNMTVGAAPDYVRLTAVLYADGTSAGEQAKVQQLKTRRALLLATIREVLAHPEKVKELRDAVTVPTNKGKRASAEGLNQISRQALLSEAVDLAARSAAALENAFRSREALIAALPAP